MRETEVISEAHHIVVDEAQDFGVMVYAVLKECVRSCTYTVMGDVSQNIRMDYGISDWEGVKKILLTGERDNFCVLRKYRRNCKFCIGHPGARSVSGVWGRAGHPSW